MYKLSLILHCPKLDTCIFVALGSLNKNGFKMKKFSAQIWKSPLQTFSWRCFKNSVHNIYFFSFKTQAPSVPRSAYRTYYACFLLNKEKSI